MKKEILIQIDEAAKILGVTTETLRRWDRAGKLKAIRVGSRSDRRYKYSDIQNILNSAENTQGAKSKGDFLELFVHDLIERLMPEWGFTLTENRHQKGGQQHGKDHIIRWTGNVEGEPLVFEWQIEDKNTGTPKINAQIDGDKIRSKLTSLYQSRVERDCWCIFSPFGYVDNEFREQIDGARVDRKYSFNIVLWTSDNKIDDLVSCFPDLYKRLYNKERIITLEQRKVYLSTWKNEVIRETQKGKELRNTQSTQQSIHLTQALSSNIAERVVKELRNGAVQASPMVVKSISTTQLSIQKSLINDDIDKALAFLNKGNTEEAKVRLFTLYGKLEGKQKHDHELARIYNNLGVAFNIERDTDKAIEYFKKAVATENNFLVALGNLASAHLLKTEELAVAKGNEKEIKLHITKAKEIIIPLWETFDKDPNPMFLQKYMHLIRAESGPNELITFIKDQIINKKNKLFNSNGTLAYLAGEAYLTIYDPEEALKYAERACKLEEDIETLTLRGRVRIALALKNDIDFPREDFQDITPRLKSRRNLLKAIKDIDEAMDIALKKEQTAWYSMIYYLQKLGRLWLGDSTEITGPTTLKSEGAELGEGLIRAVNEFRVGDIERSYESLRQLPNFISLPYPELFRYGRVYANNGYPEIALEIFKLLEEQSAQKKDFRFWMDYSVIFVLLEEKNKAFWAAAKAREFAHDNNRRVAFSHYGAVMLRYASEEGGDRMLENSLLFDKEFPELKVVEEFNFEKDKEKIIGMIKEKYTWAEKIKQIFKENPIPTYYLQETFKKPYIVVWAKRDPEMPFAYTIPSKEFYDELENNYKKGGVFTFDYLSLLTLSKLNLLTDLGRICPKMQISFSLFQKIQDELMQEENADLRKLWNFLRKTKSIKIVRKIPHVRINSKALKNILEPWMIDTIKLAKSKDAVMVTDDFRLFRFFKGDEFKLTSINSWLILQKCRNKGYIDATMYSKALGKLAESFYQFISFNGDDLFVIVAEDDFKLSARSYHLINQIFLPESEFESFAKVFTKFILNMWRPGLILEDKLYWLKYLTDVHFSYVDRKLLNGVLLSATSSSGPALGALWGAIILSSTKEELLTVKEKINELIPQALFVKIKEKVILAIDNRLGKLK